MEAAYLDADLASPWVGHQAGLGPGAVRERAEGDGLRLAARRRAPEDHDEQRGGGRGGGSARRSQAEACPPPSAAFGAAFRRNPAGDSLAKLRWRLGRRLQAVRVGAPQHGDHRGEGLGLGAARGTALEMGLDGEPLVLGELAQDESPDPLAPLAALLSLHSPSPRARCEAP